MRLFNNLANLNHQTSASWSVRHSYRHLLIVGLLSIFAAAVWAEPQTADTSLKEKLVLAVHEHDDKVDLQQRYQPLVDYLTQTSTDYAFELKIMTMSEFKKGMDTNQIDVAIVHPYLYFHLRENRSFVKSVATMQRQTLGHVSHSVGEVLVTQRNSKINNLAMLENRSIGYYGDQIFETFHLSYYTLFKAGVGLDEIDRIGFRNNQKLLQSLLKGEVDVAIFDTGWLETAYQKGLLAADEVRVLNAKQWPDYPLSLSTDLYPGSPFILVKPLPQKIQKAISSALFSYQAASGAEVYGFIPPLNYSPLETALREMRFAPYDSIPQVTLQELAYQYRYQFIILSVLVVMLVGLYLQSLYLKQRVSSEHRRLNSLIDGTHAMLWDWDIVGGKVDLNHYWTEFLGYRLDELNPMTKQRWMSLIHPEDQQKVSTHLNLYLEEFQNKPSNYQVSFRIAHKNGGWKWVMARGEVTEKFKSGQPKRMSGIHIDIDQLKSREEALSHRSEIDQALLHLPILAETMNEHDFMQKAQEIAENLTQSKISFIHLMLEESQKIELVAWSKRTLEDYCEVEEYSEHYPLNTAGIWADSARTGKPLVVNDYARYPNKNGLPSGHAKLTRLVSLPVKEGGKIVMIAGVGNKQSDYTSLDVEIVQLIANETWRLVKDNRVQKKLQLMANYDQLTGLANRFLIMDRLEHSLQKLQRNPKPLALMFIDLDGFKYINDHFGHEAGDYLLKELTGRFKEEIRSEDSLGRIGGDEFVLLLEAVDDSSIVEKIAERILKQAAKTVEFNEHCLKVSASIGIVLYNGKPQMNASELINRADKAMYVAKNSGKNQIHTDSC